MSTEDERRNFRLSREVWPSRYDLALTLDLDAWTSAGAARIALRLNGAARQITLHSVDLQIDRAAVGATEASVSYDHLAQNATLTFAQTLAAGEQILEVSWRGPISERLRGLYRSTRSGERYATTQFEQNDARRAFPCFDEPEYKAVFALRLVHPAGLVAIANAPILTAEVLPGGGTATTFAPTPRISSYLVAFMVGPFASTPPVMSATGWPVQVWAPPGLAEKGIYARDAHRQALEWLEAYTGIPYPYTKVDAIGLADFEAGAMENPGAITYRATYLAADPTTATTGMLKSVFSVAAHELTHMWWGDLVTMRWWNDLWLNESFASFIGEKCTDALNPTWGYLRDCVAQSERAFGLDALASTHPISTEAKSAEEAGERFDAVSYIKGQAVLRMIENHIGAAAFRRGVQIYLGRHREGNADANDFWKAIDEASGKDVTHVANSWILEKGFPLVTCVVRAEADALVVTFRQKRFFADPDLPVGDQRWAIPLVITVGTAKGTREVRTLLDGTEMTVRLDGATWYFPNAGGIGFYRYDLDADSLARVARGIKELSPVERLALVNDQWALTVTRKAGVGAYLGLVEALRGETDQYVLGAISGALGWLSANAVEETARPRFERFVDRFFRPRLEVLGWDLRVGESSDDREERTATLGLLGRIARAPDVRTEARRRIDAHLTETAVLAPDALAALIPVAATDGELALWERYDARRRAKEAGDAQDEARFRGALCDFRDPAIAERTARLIFSTAIRAQDRGLMFARLFATVQARAVGWAVLREQWDEFVAGAEPGIKQNFMGAMSQLTDADLAPQAIALLRAKVTPEMREMTEQTIERIRLSSATALRVRGDLAAAFDRIGA